ncbi:MAG: HAMP domain-containing protein [Alphaproteobacteria bacterium TMED194]|jgi:class 3 adenylate cyclase|nr:MAG: HAMP domain-containing protein [Alphaproteobacteria bacterium TMED194]|tara:strand:- start:392 stop:2515 length:2124 start_codon:yes stop_codon:yes gene_type:complete
MLLRTRILLALAAAFTVITMIMLYQNFLSREQIQKALIKEVSLGQNVIWDKILSGSHEQMEFYAYDSRPGTPSIWALRGKRSAVAAVEKKNPRLITKVIGKFYNGLFKTGVIDHLFIFDEEGAPIHHLSDDNISKFDLKKISVEALSRETNNETISGLSLINDEICSVVIFKIFSNGRVIGQVVYAKKILPLVNDFVESAQADYVALADPLPLFTQKYIGFSDFKNNINDEVDIIVTAGKFFSVNRYDTLLLDKSTISQYFIRDITEAITEYNRTFIISAILIVLALFAIGIIITAILRSGFKPLYSAINALNLLSDGNTDVDVKVKGKDEVSQIASAVKSFRETLLNYRNVRSVAIENRQNQEEKIIGETLKLSSLLPAEQRKALRKDVYSMENLNRANENTEKNLFSTDENQTMAILTIAFSRIAKEIKALFRKQVQLTEAYQRFVPEQLLESLDKKSILDVKLGNQVQKEMTILFSDIRSFTNISEKLEPAENFKFVNDYLAAVVPSIRKYDGYVDKYIGDAIMALFTKKSSDAVYSAIDMLSKLEKLNKKRVKEGLPNISIGIGINTGSVMLGTLGVPDRMEGSVISDTVNLSARLEELTKFYQVPLIVSSETERMLPQTISRREIDEIEVKGKTNRVRIFEVFQWEPKKTRDKKIELSSVFKEALNLYRKNNLTRCLKLLKKYEKKLTDDPILQLYIKRCEG